MNLRNEHITELVHIRWKRLYTWSMCLETVKAAYLKEPHKKCFESSCRSYPPLPPGGGGGGGGGYKRFRNVALAKKEWFT